MTHPKTVQLYQLDIVDIKMILSCIKKKKKNYFQVFHTPFAAVFLVKCKMYYSVYQQANGNVDATELSN